MSVAILPGRHAKKGREGHQTKDKWAGGEEDKEKRKGRVQGKTIIRAFSVTSADSELPGLTTSKTQPDPLQRCSCP